jgi:hypothetical protein
VQGCTSEQLCYGLPSWYKYTIVRTQLQPI